VRLFGTCEPSRHTHHLKCFLESKLKEKFRGWKNTKGSKSKDGGQITQEMKIIQKVLNAFKILFSSHKCFLLGFVPPW